MKVLQVVTLISPDGAFGGPVRAAENQALALRDRGHDVTVVAGYRGDAKALEQSRGGTTELFPVRKVVPTRGFSGLSAPRMLAFLGRELERVDVVHVHLARDLVTMPAARLAQRAGTPYLVQPQGMIDEPDHALARPFDALLTRRVLRGAASVLYLTPEERSSLVAVAGHSLRLRLLHNAVPVSDDVPELPHRPEVLFCSRLHRRKRPVMFAEMAKVLIAEGVDASFVLVGPDEGEGRRVSEAVDAVGNADRLRWEGPLDRTETLQRMRRASMLVLPAVAEPYPLAVLEAMSVGRPVVITRMNGLAPEVLQHGCGEVVDDSLEQLVHAVRRGLGDPVALAATGRRAALASAQHFSLEAVASRLEALYEEATSLS